MITQKESLPISLEKNLYHDSKGMYLVRKVEDYRFDVYQSSSDVVVASAAGKDTADNAASRLNACAVIPRLINERYNLVRETTLIDDLVGEQDLYDALMRLNKLLWKEGYTLSNPEIANADQIIKRYEEIYPDRVIDPSKL